MTTRSKLTARPVLFAGVVLLHGLAYYAMRQYVVFPKPTTSTAEAPQFQLVKIGVSPALPPPPPPVMVPMANLAGGESALSQTPMPAPTIALTPRFTVPVPDLNGAGATRHVIDVLHSGGGSRLGNLPGSGISNGPKDPENGSGGIADIRGLKISTGETIAVLYDNSGSMREVGGYVQKCVGKFFFGTDITTNDGCIGHYIPGDTTQEKNNDFYYQGYELEKELHDGKPITALVMISDWEDGDHTAATTAFVTSLREHHIKLFLLSVEANPYPGLIDYAKESGGQVSITTKLAIKALQ
jgi:hypothetical protein